MDGIGKKMSWLSLSFPISFIHIHFNNFPISYLKCKTEIPLIIDINLINMIQNKFLFLIIVVVAVATGGTTSFANAQEQTPPPLEKPTTTTGSSLGKIIIQFSQAEQIIIDLPLKSENKYFVIPIK